MAAKLAPMKVLETSICKPRHWNHGIGIAIGILTDITNVIISNSIRTPNVAGWQLRIRGPHPQCHATLQLCDHVKNQKYFIFTFTRRKAHEFNRVVIKRPQPTCHVSPLSRRHVTPIQ